jgi:hypothetical protein
MTPYLLMETYFGGNRKILQLTKVIMSHDKKLYWNCTITSSLIYTYLRLHRNKGYILSMIEATMKITNYTLPAAFIKEIIEYTKLTK